MRSRFATYGGDDEPEEGGVRAVSTSGGRPSRGHAASNGVPGPEALLLDITELVRNVGMHYVHHFALPADYEPDLSAAEPIAGKLTLTNTGAALILRGKATTQISIQCGRCLEPRLESVEAELEENFDLVTGGEGRHADEVVALDEENPEAPAIQNNILNLGELLRQNLIVAAPLGSTCPDDCPNLIKIAKWSTGEPETKPALSRLGELLQAAQEAE